MNNEQKILNYYASWSISQALTFMFLVPFAVFLGLTNIQIGIVSAMPYASLILSQITTLFFSEKVCNRKKFVLTLSFITRLFLIPLLVLPFVSNAPVYFIILIFLLYFVGEIASPALMSIIADFVPEKIRGRFFARKNIYIAQFTTIPYLLAGFFLDIFPKNSPTGFIMLFAMGAVISFFSLTFIASIKEPEYKPVRENFSDVFKFRGEYGKFTLFMTVFSFAYMIASPFFVVYLLKNLGLGYSYFVLATSISTACRVIFSKPIGKISDKYGDKPVAIVSTFATALVPLTYLFFVSPQNVWLIIPAEIISGIAWAGFDLSTVNLLLDFTTKEDRIMQIAKFNIVTAVPMIIAPIIAGYLSENVLFIWAGIPLLFALSAILRVVAAPLLFSIKEERAKKEYPVRTILREYYHMPMRTLRTAERGLVAFVHHKETKSS